MSAFPSDIGVIDLMIGFPSANARRHYDFMKPQLHDKESAEMEFPAEYMFKDVPNRLDDEQDSIAVTLGEMDKCGVAMGLVGLGPGVAVRAIKEHPDRFIPAIEIDPNKITDAVRKIRAAYDEHNIKAVTTFPGRVQPAGAGERPPLLPDLPDLHRPRHPDRRRTPASPDRGCRRRARTSCTSTRSATTSRSCGS